MKKSGWTRAVAVIILFAAAAARADTTITVDGDLSDWPADGFYFLDPERDTFPWRDITEIRVTDDNQSGNGGNLYFGVTFRSNFRPSVMGIDIDVFFYLDIDGDGQISGPNDRVIEATEGTVTDGDGNVLGSIGAMAFDHENMEVSVPYALLGLEHGSDVFGVAARTVGFPGIDDQSPEPGAGDNGFIVYDGTQDPEPRAVLLADLAARAEKNGVIVEWATGSERENAGFEVWKMIEGRWRPLTKRLVRGLGTSPVGRNYSFRDHSGSAGDVYLLVSVEFSGRRQYHGPVVASKNAPAVTRIRNGKRTNSVTRSIVGTRLRRGGLSLARAYRMYAEHRGLYRLPLLPGGVWLRLLREGRPVPVTHQGDSWYFLANPKQERWSDDDVLALERGRGVPMRTRQISGCANPAGEATYRLELHPQHVYYIAAAGDDPFYWAMLWDGAPATLEVGLKGMVTPPSGFHLTIAGVSARHGAKVFLNGKQVATLEWTGREDRKFWIGTDPSLWAEGANTITVEESGESFDLLVVEGIELAYKRRLVADGATFEFEAPSGTCLRLEGLEPSSTLLFDVTDENAPVRLDGGSCTCGCIVFRDGEPGNGTRRYLAVDTERVVEPERVRPIAARHLAGRKGAEAVVIADRRLSGAAADWCGLQGNLGRTCIEIYTDEIYDTYSYGRPGAEPIRQFLRQARVYWTIRPGYLLLLGSASVDPNGYTGQGAPDLVPTFFYRTRRGYEAASDRWFAEDSRGRAWLAVGRLAAEGPEQARLAVAKAAEARRKGISLAPALLVADSYNPQDPAVPDRSFYDQAVALRRLCLDRAGLDAAILDKAASSDPRQELSGAIEAGTGLLVFLGHAYVSGWSSSPVIMDNDIADGLSNDTWPLLVSLSCFDGAFAGPWAESLAWHFVANPQGGAAAAMAASSLSRPEALEVLGRRLLCSLAGAPGETVGQVLKQVGNTLAEDPLLRDLVSTFNLLGDPTLPLE